RAGEGGLAGRPPEIARSRQCRIHLAAAGSSAGRAHRLSQSIGLIQVMSPTAPDVLLLMVVMFAGGTAASHLLFRKSPMARAIARVGFLILLTIALLYAGIVPYQPLQSTGVA